MKKQSKINVYSGIRFYTNDGLEVTEYVKLGKTTVFKDRDEAEAYAKQKRSYTYDLRYTDAKDKHKIKKIYGYGVPN